MAKVIKSFYKLSESKTYKIGDNTNFSKDVDLRLEKEGLIKLDVKPTSKTKPKNKK
jgi:hypothetical protein